MASTERGDSSPSTARPLTSSRQLLEVPVDDSLGLRPVGSRTTWPGFPRVEVPQVLRVCVEGLLPLAARWPLCAIASSLLVVLPMAETTTTGRRSTRASTMEATRSMAAADSTDVPPNFITIIANPAYSSPSRNHQFRVQHGRAGGAAHRVVPQRHELLVEHRAGAQAADENGHAALRVRRPGAAAGGSAASCR